MQFLRPLQRSQIWSMIASRRGTEYPRPPPLCEEALQERELVWARLPKTIYQGTMSCLTVGDCCNLDSAMTNRELRPHLVKAYKDLESPAFNGYLYTDEEDFRVLRWVMERGINLRGFSMQVKGERKSGPVMRLLMGKPGEVSHRDIAEDYAARGKLVGVNVAYKGYTALMWASYMGYLDIAKALLAAGADKEKADTNGNTALMHAAGRGHVETVR